MKKFTSILLALLIAVTVFTSLPFTVSAAETEESEVSSGVSFLLTDNFGWGTAYVFAWDEYGHSINGEWPGSVRAETTTNELGETEFIINVPEGAVGVVVNNGNGAQTENITDFSYGGYWMDGSVDSLGHYIVTGYNPTGSEETTTEEPFQYQTTFFLTDSMGWSSAYLYAWDAGNTLICSAYPLQRVAGEYGIDQFVVTVPDGAARIIINNGSGALTEDITDFTSYAGYWMDGSRDSLGHYKVTGWINVETQTTFKLTDNFGWGQAYVYAWDAEGNEIYGSWPGSVRAETTTNKFGETQFIINVPEGAVGVIVNNGYNAQTEDITDFSYEVYWMDGSRDSLGHYKVIGWNNEETQTQPTTEEPVQYQATFKLTDNFGWGQAYVYAWDAEGNEIYGAWPGANMAETITNKFGETQFIINVPEGAVGVIVNNGYNAQTEDITDFSYCGYWMDGSADDMGHYLVTGYVHSEVIDNAVPATCTETGLTQGSHCSYCGKILQAQEVIPATGHTIVTDEGYAATCIETGLTEGSHCSVCGEILQAQEVIPATGHTVVVDEGYAATCTETGLTEGSHCSVCNEILQAQEVIPATGHTVVIDEGYAATCTEAGLTEGSHCSVCGEILLAQETIPAAHDMVEDIRFDATCTEDGVVYTHCSRCGELGEEVLPALGHDFSEWTTNVQVTCEADGEEESECTRCGVVEKRVIPKLGHDYAAVVTPATCTEGGYTTYTCSRCQDTYTDDEVAALGHDYAAVVTPATCTEGGYTTHTCSHCQDTYTDNEVEALGHEYIINVRRNATLTSQGLMAVRCDRCGTQQNVILPKLSETDYTITNNTATCTEAGTATYTWKDTTYGTYSVEAATPSKGHTPEVLARVEPTCTETGLTEGSHCSVCGEVFVAQEVIPATGHTVVTDPARTATCTETGLTEGSHCSVCNEIIQAQEEIPANGHIEVIDAGYEPTCTETGLTEGIHCAVCGEVITAQEVIPANGHHGVVVPGVPATTTTTGLTDGEKCDICGEWIVEQQVIPVIAQGVVDGVYYENGVAKNVGLVRIGKDFYCTTRDGKLIYGDKEIFSSRTNGLLPPGTYHFDEVTGKLYKDNVIIDDVYYKEGAAKNVGIVKVAGAYYVTTTKGVITKDAYNKYIASSRTNGLVAIGYYDFGPDGKMILRNGIVGGKYYVNGKATNVGLFEYEAEGVTNIYCTTTGGVILKDVTNKYIASSRTNGLAPAGYYSFDADGKMIK